MAFERKNKTQGATVKSFVNMTGGSKAEYQGVIKSNKMLSKEN